MSPASRKTIFLDAIELEDPQQRADYLIAACGADVELRTAVEALLAAHERPENLLDRPLVENPMLLNEKRELQETDLHVATKAGPDEQIGSTIGGYRLMEQIGEGGFGLVYVAQQEKPVRRKVALKIIKPGTESQQVLARFDAERQAVAMMDHPNIAQVFDAGVTPDGRPFFVMELVRGAPITAFADQYHLSLRRRLELFRDVCSATHHAHQKGIIHRDLKPSNVMVALHDDKPVVKVIDFGVAKAMGQNLTEQTIYTQFYSMVGTPLYMSPEQASMSGLDADTRSDIYSLGVLLYELLTGTTPFDGARLSAVGFDKMRKIIREEEPPRPSERLTTIRMQHRKVTKLDPVPSDSIAANEYRNRESVPDDLDWIVMKAMEKDRSRRYESAAAMSADLNRFLLQEPIEARPPSRLYRLSKFARRNRVAIVTTSLVATALVVGTIVSLYQASIAIAERNEKDAALQDAILARQEVESFAENLKDANLLLGGARYLEEEERFGEADAAFTEAVRLVPNYYLVWVQRGTLRARVNLWEEAAADFSKALELEAPIDSRDWQGVAGLFFITNREADYRTIYSRLLPPANKENTRPLNWNAVRSCLISPLNANDAQRMVTSINALMEQDVAPGMFGPGFGPGGQGGGPSGMVPNAFGPGGLGPRNVGRGNIGPNNIGPGGRHGPGGPEGAKGGPAEEDRLPLSLQHYVAGLARLRVADYQAALEYFEMAERGPGPSGNKTHAGRAIALHQLGQMEQAANALAKAADVLDGMIEEMAQAPNAPRPWFDFLESVLLYREASFTITGQYAQLDTRILAAQLQTRRLLEFDSR